MSAGTPVAGQESGQLSIHAEGLLPIIKRYLYQDQEVFLRELVANAVDATTKLKHLAMLENLGEVGQGRVEVKVDSAAKTITISDEGVGMSAEEVRTYLNQVAFSGAQEFLKKYEGAAQGQPIIGHFGLGFYSAFMVAKRVEVRTKSYKEGSEAVTWSSEGGLDYQMQSGGRDSRGTDVVLHLADDAADEFGNPTRLRHLLNTHCRFMPVPLFLDGSRINELEPIWTKSPSALKDEDYLGFFRALYPYEDDPLFWIHLNVDYPFNLKGVLYFPKISHEFDASKGNIQLYCNQVFVTDQTGDLIPRFLGTLKGVLDSPDVPLNVSRSALQGDATVRKIAGHVSKKVADRLVALFKGDREAYEAKWPDVAPFVKFGAMDDEKFREAILPAVLWPASKGGLVTLQELLDRRPEGADQSTVYYADGQDKQAAYLSLFHDQGLEAAVANGPLDVAFIQWWEHHDPKLKWRRVDAGVADALKEAEPEAELLDASGQSASERLKAWATGLFQGVQVEVASLKNAEVAGLITQDEDQRRMKELSALHGLKGMDWPDQRSFLLNRNHPLVQRMMGLQGQPEGEALAHQVYDLARLSHGDLKGEELAAFIKRSQDLLAK